MDLQDSILGTSVVFFYPSIITLVAVLSAAAGVWLTSFATLSRRLVPFGGGVLLGVALFCPAGNGAIFQLAGCDSVARGRVSFARGRRPVCLSGVPGLFPLAPARSLRHPAAWVRHPAAGCRGAAQRLGRMERG